jgi:glucans biosynthesis protein
LPPLGKPFEIAYRIYFQSHDPLDPGSGRAIATRMGVGDRPEWKRIVVDFEGDKIKALSSSTPVKAVITLGQDGQLMQQTVLRNAVTRGWRLSFQVKPATGKPLELRAFLQNGKDVISETWSYQLEP